MSKRLAPMLVLGVLVALVPIAAARTTGTLTLTHAALAGAINQVDCPAGTDDTTACFQISGTGVVRGLGVVSDSYLLFVENPDSSCEVWHATVVLNVRGKGELDLAVRPPNGCVVPTTGVLNASLVFTITGGSGQYVGASGHGTLETRGGPGTTGRNTDTLGGSLTVPNLRFDTTPPVIKGAVSKTVAAPRNAKAVRVFYRATATDTGRGVPVTCRPRSGSRFKVGPTRVLCSATDSSGNTAKARFTITVKRKR
jgi:HYR domain